MNNNLRRSVVSLSAALLLALPVFAAAPDPAVDYPLERGTAAGEQWRKMLGLSAEQARKFTLLENEKAARLKPLRELLRNEMVKLQSLLAEGGSERDVEDSLEQVLQINRAIAERSERVDAGLSAFLSASQRARLLVWRSLGGLDGYAARRLEPASRPDEEMAGD
jgi:hypothetical protein